MATIKSALQTIQAYNGPPIKIMEVCGTHTAAIFKSGIRTLLPKTISLVSGPGCPVCVTPSSVIDTLFELSFAPNTCVMCFGDMFRVRGKRGSLAEAKATGGDVRMFYTPLEALTVSQLEPDTKVVVAAVGFESTLPVYALLVQRVLQEQRHNIQLVTALKHIIPAVTFALSEDSQIDALICPGHVGAVLGTKPFAQLSVTSGKPFVMAGFETAHIVAAVYDIVNQVTSSSGKFVNLYPEVVTTEGNEKAMAIIDTYFTLNDSIWRGLGNIAGSGFYLKDAYSHLNIPYTQEEEPSDCACGQVLLGKLSPDQCALFGSTCTPSQPVGPCMVSHEGACGLWYAARKVGGGV